MISGFTGESPAWASFRQWCSLSVLLDSVQEYRAEQAAEQLKVSVALKEQVLRDGREITIRADQLVPGDVVLLAAGDMVPADGRLLEARDFFVNEGLLTGESYPTEKHVVAEGTANVDVVQAANAAFMGTSVVSGSAKLLLARPATLPHSARSAPLAKPPPAALERGVYEFGILIVWLTILLVLFVLLVNTFFHRSLLESFLFALAPRWAAPPSSCR